MMVDETNVTSSYNRLLSKLKILKPHDKIKNNIQTTKDLSTKSTINNPIISSNISFSKYSVINTNPTPIDPQLSKSSVEPTL